MSELYVKLKPFLGDEQKLIERMAGRMDLWEECVLLFPGPELIEKTDSALREEDGTVLYQEVHRLKGNLANFGFDRAAEKAFTVLQAIKEKDMGIVRQSYTELREEYLQITERIGEVK
ncbi:MAG: Hpt domain-containing protein [Lachnospiraceae bacterium]|nr:Hpt domain-containing protein [Lachnospiraceae bacterium]